MKNHPFVNLLVRWAVLAVGVVLADQLIDGIWCDTTGALIAAVLILSLLNAALKPVLVLFTLPFILLTLGLGMVVINALLLLLVDRLVGGFHVDGFWPAFWGSLIISITNLVMNSLMKKKPVARDGGPPSPPARKPPSDDVIDI